MTNEQLEKMADDLGNHLDWERDSEQYHEVLEALRIVRDSVVQLPSEADMRMQAEKYLETTCIDFQKTDSDLQKRHHYQTFLDGVRWLRAQLKTVQLQWNDGAPDKIYGSEWFIALTDDGDRVVLRALPEGRSYDFATCDDTYLRRSKIKCWMQFPDSQFTPYEKTVEPISDDSGPITQERLDKLLNAEIELEALHACGVDNWSGYADAMEMINGK